MNMEKKINPGKVCFKLCLFKYTQAIINFCAQTILRQSDTTSLPSTNFFDSVLAFYGLQVTMVCIYSPILQGLLQYLYQAAAAASPLCISNLLFRFNLMPSIQRWLFLNSSAVDKPRQQENVWLQLEHKQIWNFITSSQRDLRDNWHTALNLSSWKDINAART